jgi:hypothetical protein
MTTRSYVVGFEPIRESMMVTSPSDDALEANIESGGEGAGVWADASMIIRAPAARVCSVLERPETVVNEGAVDKWHWRPLDEEPSPGVMGFVLANTVERAITVTFEIAWTFASNPETEGCVGRWAIQRAPRFIASNRGWVSVESLDDELTLVEVQAELDAPRVDASVPHRYLEDLTEKLRIGSTEQ